VFFRLFILFNLLFINLYACKGGYESCKQKIKDSHSIQNHQLRLIVNKHQRLIYSKTKPSGKILKHDPYLHLYLVEDKKGFEYPFLINHRVALGIAAVNKKDAVEGRIKTHQLGLHHFATFSEPLPKRPCVLVTSCCSLEGIVTTKGIIEKEYIDRFLKIKKVQYADIGIQLKKENKKIFVIGVNTFQKNNPFKINDVILAFNGKKVHNESSLLRWILFSKIGSISKVKIQRNSKVLTLKVKNQNRYGSGTKESYFFEFFGLSLDKKMKIANIKANAKKYHLKLGDKLLMINQKNVSSPEGILKILSQTKESVNLLFQRDDFQFFVKVN
jgi:hypothetical protein